MITVNCLIPILNADFTVLIYPYESLKGLGISVYFVYTGMDITCLYTSSWEFICEGLTHSLCPRHVERNNYVPLFGVDPIECRLTLLRNT